MRFMMIVKANQNSEAGKPPSEELFAAMTQFNEELIKAGALIELAGLHPSSKGARVQVSNGKRMVIDGPFAETKELIAGFWLIRANSMAEAIEWAKRVPAPHGESAEGQIEIRQVFELEDFAPSPSVERAKVLRAKRLEGSLAESNA
ncbi:MAG TPA: YciI family protein [Terriglobales bacterium]